MSVIGSGLLGYCPKCNEPVVENFESLDSLEMLSRCKSGHIYPSVNTQVSPNVVTEESKEKPDEYADLPYKVIARACHNINAEYCKAMGDNSQPRWCDAPDWQKESAYKGVKMYLDNPTAGPEQSHESWMEEKERDGWKYGPVKDPENKTHPCMVPFDQLPREQQAKDYIFRAVVHNFII